MDIEWVRDPRQARDDPAHAVIAGRYLGSALCERRATLWWDPEPDPPEARRCRFCVAAVNLRGGRRP